MATAASASSLPFFCPLAHLVRADIAHTNALVIPEPSHLSSSCHHLISHLISSPVHTAAPNQYIVQGGRWSVTLCCITSRLTDHFVLRVLAFPSQPSWPVCLSHSESFPFLSYFLFLSCFRPITLLIWYSFIFQRQGTSPVLLPTLAALRSS